MNSYANYIEKTEAMLDYMLANWPFDFAGMTSEEIESAFMSHWASLGLELL